METPLLYLSNKNKKTKVFLAFDLLNKVVFNKNMTLSLRNTLIKVTLSISIALFSLYLLSSYYLQRKGLLSTEKILSLLKQNNPDIDSLGDLLFWTIVTASILFAFSIITSLLLFHYFKKKISPEIFFFILFILSLSLQSVRLFQFQLLLMNMSPFFGVIVTRFYHFFRLFGVFCLFASSLFPIGVKFQKFGTILLTILLLSFTIAALMPIDPTTMDNNFLYRVGDNTSIQIMTISVRVLTIINFTRVALTTKSRNYLLILIASFLIIAGDMLLLVLPIPLIAFSFILAGTLIYSRSIYNYYLWI
jgi:hypothetical protein